jgi:hypothetical protein
MEKAYLQYVSGWMFDSFGLKPALGRLDTPLRTGSEGYRTHIPDRQHALRDRRRRWSAIHRHGDRYDDRHLPSHDDESLGQPFRWDLVAGDRAAEAGCGSRADSPETAGNRSRSPECPAKAFITSSTRRCRFSPRPPAPPGCRQTCAFRSPLSASWFLATRSRSA